MDIWDYRRALEDILSVFLESESVSDEEKLKVMGGVELINGYVKDRGAKFEVERYGFKYLSDEEFKRIQETEFILMGIIISKIFENLED